MDHGNLNLVVNDEVFDRGGLVGVDLWSHHLKIPLVRLGDRSGELLYGMLKAESTGTRDLEWKELVAWDVDERVQCRSFLDSKK